MGAHRLSLAVLLALAALPARADAPRERFTLGGYFRVMARPDLQGGDGRLGLWNLSGRLLNEGPYAALEAKLDILQDAPGRFEPWAAVHAKVEGGSVQGTDVFNGSLTQYRMSQLYVRAGNVLLDGVVWQLGTLHTYFGDLGLYDMRPSDLFFETVGLSARVNRPRFEAVVAVGDSGFFLRGASGYQAVPTVGGNVRWRALPGRLEVGVGGQLMAEPHVAGSRRAAYQTPGISYEDYARREVALRFLEANPTLDRLFPAPNAARAESFKLVGYLGFGGFGPVRWNNLFVNFLRLHPDAPVTEQVAGRTFSIHVTNFTDERYQLNAGNELQLRVLPDVLDVNWGLLFGHHVDLDDRVRASEANRTFYSTVVRGQLYLTSTVHLLLEGSAAREESRNGNLYRLHVDSVFQSARGVSDARGLEYGDARVRETYQLKGGVVFNPAGRGIYTRPSLRLLYGAQYSNVHAAFGSGFVESLDEANLFRGPERHWHHVVSIEAEGWF
ncbi:MAG: hypothetical protein FJ086_02030 [Deltaproteobacteria bacterium]|nr:hypothetical protein [Deltaproteobacteria bacterium]